MLRHLGSVSFELSGEACQPPDLEPRALEVGHTASRGFTEINPRKVLPTAAFDHHARSQFPNGAAQTAGQSFQASAFLSRQTETQNGAWFCHLAYIVNNVFR